MKAQKKTHFIYRRFLAILFSHFVFTSMIFPYWKLPLIWFIFFFSFLASSLSIQFIFRLIWLLCSKNEHWIVLFIVIFGYFNCHHQSRQVFHLQYLSNWKRLKCNLTIEKRTIDCIIRFVISEIDFYVSIKRIFFLHFLFWGEQWKEAYATRSNMNKAIKKEHNQSEDWKKTKFHLRTIYWIQ